MKRHFSKKDAMDDERGFTLIELMLYATLSGVIMTGVYLSFNTSTDIYADVLRSSVAVQDAQRAADVLEREAKSVKNRTSILIATSTRFKLTNNADAAIDLQYSAQRILRNNDVLASGVSGFVFSYYKWDGTAWTSASPTSQIARVRYVFSVSYRGYAYSVDRTVLLRNMR